MVSRMLGLVIALGVPGVLSAEPGAPGRLEGRVIPEGSAALAKLGPLAVHLEPLKGAPDFEVPKDIPKISQKNVRFSPNFLVVAAGQTVEMPNDDLVVHNVFSFSRPNNFDLGLYPKGQTKSVTFEHAGVVDIFCSIHTRMRATIVVAPTPYHATVGKDGTFAIEGVPAGTYRLRVWGKGIKPASKEVSIRAGRSDSTTLTIEKR